MRLSWRPSAGKGIECIGSQLLEEGRKSVDNIVDLTSHNPSEYFIQCKKVF